MYCNIVNPLCWLELVKKFLVVVVVCKPILVFSLGFDQDEQQGTEDVLNRVTITRTMSGRCT